MYFLVFTNTHTN